MDKTPVALGASAIYHLHNHPSGDPAPSPEDRSIHRRLTDVGLDLGIRVEDGIVLGHEKFRRLSKDEPEGYSAELRKVSARSVESVRLARQGHEEGEVLTQPDQLATIARKMLDPKALSVHAFFLDAKHRIISSTVGKDGSLSPKARRALLRQSFLQSASAIAWNAGVQEAHVLLKNGFDVAGVSYLDTVFVGERAVRSMVAEPGASYGIAKAHVLQGHREVRGVDIAIENRKGSRRYWTDPATGEKGSTKLPHPYGYVPRTRSTDGEGHDVFVGDTVA